MSFTSQTNTHGGCLLAALVVSTLLTLGCQPDTPPSPKAPSPKPKAQTKPKLLLPDKPKAKKPRKASSYEGLLATINRDLATHKKLAAQQRSWPRLARLASIHMRRARLTGDQDDYQYADTALEEAFSLSKPGSGPLMTRARLNFTLHRFGAADADLDAFSRSLLLKDAQKAAIASMRADLALYRGQTDKARESYKAAIGHSVRSMKAYARQAIFHARLGDYEAAETGLNRAAALVGKIDHLGAAWIHLQRGLLDLERHRLDEAMAHYKDADAALSGWWLVEEHIAEIHALKGAHDKAQDMYRDLIIRTQSPEFMSALAESLTATGALDEARTWLDKATARYEDQMKRFPEATWGHALDHFLASEPTSARTLDLAQKNHALRPGAEASILLAQVHMARGSLKEARGLIDAATATGWKTPDLLATHAELLHRENKVEKADQMCRAANAVSPGVCALPAPSP